MHVITIANIWVNPQSFDVIISIFLEPFITKWLIMSIIGDRSMVGWYK